MPGNQVDAGDNEYAAHDCHGRELIMQEHDRQERAKQWLDKESRCGRGSFHPGQSLEPGEISNYGSQERQPDYTKPCNKAQGMPARIDDFPDSNRRPEDHTDNNRCRGNH